MRSQQKIQNLLHVLIRGILRGESVDRVRDEETEPKIFSRVKSRGKHVE